MVFKKKMGEPGGARNTVQVIYGRKKIEHLGLCDACAYNFRHVFYMLCNLEPSTHIRIIGIMNMSFMLFYFYITSLKSKVITLY